MDCSDRSFGFILDAKKISTVVKKIRTITEEARIMKIPEIPF